MAGEPYVARDRTFRLISVGDGSIGVAHGAMAYPTTRETKKMRWFLAKGPQGMWWIVPNANRFMWDVFRKRNFSRPVDPETCGWRIEPTAMPPYTRGPVDITKLMFEDWHVEE